MVALAPDHWRLQPRTTAAAADLAGVHCLACLQQVVELIASAALALGRARVGGGCPAVCRMVAMALIASAALALSPVGVGCPAVCPMVAVALIASVAQALSWVAVALTASAALAQDLMQLGAGLAVAAQTLIQVQGAAADRVPGGQMPTQAQAAADHPGEGVLKAHLLASCLAEAAVRLEVQGLHPWALEPCPAGELHPSV